MKLAKILLLLALGSAFAMPCAAQSGKQHTGLRPASDAKGKWGFIDRTGRFRIQPQFDKALEFSDGVAFVSLWENGKRRNGIVDANGKFTELQTNGYEVTFHDGLAQVIGPSNQERKYGFIDKTGRVIIEPQFHMAGNFSEGLAWAAVLKEQQWLYGFIDKTGKFIIEPQFTMQPGDFLDGLAKVAGRYNYGFIDRTGVFRVPPEFQALGAFFSEGLAAAVPPGEPLRGVYLERDGKVAFEIPQWQQRSAQQRSYYGLRSQLLPPFSEGLAPFFSFNKIGFIDKTGKVAIAPLFRETNGFSEGLAAVKIIGSDGQYVWGYIGRAGKFAIEPRFKTAQPFAGGLAQVETPDGKLQLIDSNGKLIWQRH